MAGAGFEAVGLTVSVGQDERTATVTVAGELDISSSDILERALPTVPAGGRLVIDLRPLSFMDSTGLRLLMDLDRRARIEGWSLAVVRADGTVADLLRLTRMEERMQVVADPAQLD